MLSKVKLALRITTNLLDDEIKDNIAEARAELIRSGVPASSVDLGGELVDRAIKTFVCANMCNDSETAEKYRQSFEYQQDCLRKSSLG